MKKLTKPSQKTLESRLREWAQLTERYLVLTPFAHPKPFTKSFSSFEQYEKWKKKQKNPIFW